jgi:tetratricopeptide (TPR) repeat protein
LRSVFLHVTRFSIPGSQVRTSPYARKVNSDRPLPAIQTEDFAAPPPDPQVGNLVVRRSLRLGLQIAILLCLTILVYANSLSNGFTMDDELYVQRNPQVTEHTLWLLFQPNTISNVFRPVTFATLALNWTAAGYKPFGYHLVNMFLHAGVVVLLLLVLRSVLERPPGGALISFAAALLFAVHPIHTEAVSSVVGRSELLAAGFLLAAWLFHLQDRWPLALLAFALALLSKESAIGLLPLALAGDYAKGKLKHSIGYAGIAGVTLLYVAALWKVQGGHFGAASVSVLDNPLTLLPAHLRILNAIRIAWKYVGLLIFPRTLSCDYSYNQILLYGNLRHLLLPTVAAVGVVVLWIVVILKRQAGFLVAGAIYFVGFAATSNIVTRTGTIFAERLAYFPSAGFCLFIAILCVWLVNRHRFAGIALTAVLVTGFAARTFARNRDWRDNTALYMSAADAVPNSAKMRASRGIVYLGKNDLERSRSDLQAALAINPDYPDAVETLGLLELRSGNREAALKYLRKALEMSSLKDFDYDHRAANLAALLIEMGNLDEAMKLLNRRIAESPNYSRLWSNRAALRVALGQFAEGLADAKTALRLDPHNEQARKVLEHPQATGLH